MLKFILPLVLLPYGALAQSFDLSALPHNFSFQSQSDDGLTTLRFVRRESGRALFEETTLYTDGTEQVSQIWVNQQSQTTAWTTGESRTLFTPHDCAPSIGECLFTWHHPDGTFEMKSVTRLVADVYFSDEYFLDGDEWVFWERDCALYDEFGFWIDYVRIFNDGESHSGARVRTEENRLDELWDICQPPLLTS